MSRYTPFLDWIDTQHNRMVHLVTQWASINTGTHHLAGLSRMSAALRQEFSSLGTPIDELPLPPSRVVGSDGLPIDLPLGNTLALRRQRTAALRVFLGIHMDTVYPVGHPFQEVERIAPNRLRGPGVADAKGGLAVMLIALEALERSPFAPGVGWEVLINSDEEIGSPGSASLLAAAGARNDIGLVFEPCLPDGNLVGERMGSGNFAAIFRGRAAHVGRDFASGRSALHAAGDFTVSANALNSDAVRFNVGKIEGGGPSNVVAELAICRFNVRVANHPAEARIRAALDQIAADVAHRHDLSVELTGEFLSPAKPMDPPTTDLFNHVAGCGTELGLTLAWRSTGGVCDGNKLAAAGLPVVDTLGPRGGDLHSPSEYLLLDSLTERAKLTALLLMKLGCGELQWTRNRQLAPDA